MERTIRVTGRGKLSVHPDTTRLLLNLEGLEKNYDAALRLSAEKTGKLRNTLEKLGFDRKDLKTRHFSVDADYESYLDKQDNWKKKFRGYRFTHGMKVEFPSDNDRLGKILYAIGKCEAKPEFRLEYTVSDPGAAKDALLRKAVADSRAKAELLTEAAGTVLGELQTIDYSWGELEFVTRPVEQLYCSEVDAACPGYAMDIEPEDIDVTDTVTVVWQLR